MTRREPDLDQISTLLGQCLGRIDEQAYRMQRSADDIDDYEACEMLDCETGMLQELIGSLVDQTERCEEADLNRTVEQAVRGCVAEVGTPIVVRQRLHQHLPRIACSPSQLAYAVQRALLLALGPLEAGAEMIVTTRCEGDTVLLEIEAETGGSDTQLAERATTLCEFLADLRGSCRVATQRGSSLIAIELPPALVAD